MSVHNEDIARIFEELADLLEIEEANPFRVRAYRNAAQTARGLGEELGAMVAAGGDLTELPGIGKELAAKIVEILESGHAKALDKLHEEVPASLEDLLRIPGLGPHRVKALYHELNITNLEQLEQAARSGRLRELSGFGPKMEQRILETVRAHRDADKRFMHATARQYAEPLVTYLQSLPGVHNVEVAGSYRRGRETVGDLDILATAQDGDRVVRGFTRYDEVEKVVSRGKTRSTVYLRCGLQVDLRVVPGESFGAALHYFTGNKSHNIQIRRIGQQHGLKINEYGVFDLQDGTEKRVAGQTEESVYAALDLPQIAPELREGLGEIEAAQSARLPQLIERSDLKGDLHVHTEASDGSADLATMAKAARQRGLRYIAITDHSQSLRVAHGLDADRLARQGEEIDRLNERLKGITLLKGCEVDILEDGSLDLPDQVLARLDIVIGAVHSKFRLSRRRQTERILRAMDSRYFTLLAHPSARLLEEREGIDVDMPRIIAGARERGCYLELDSQPKRLDLTDVYCRQAKEEGVLISVDSDAHGPNGFDLLEGGIVQARRGWLERENVLNTRSLTDLRKALRAIMG